MRFVVYGAGAVGGSLGALLFEAGHEVILIARGKHLDAIREHGLRFQTADSDRLLPIEAVEHPDEIEFRPGDVVLMTMKGQDTIPALRELAAVADPGTPIVCVQNGVANERMALRIFPNVYGICVMFPATHLEPGVVQANCSPVPAILDIGRYPRGVDATAEEIAAAIRSAGCHSETRDDIMPWKYRKLLMNLGNAFQAISGSGDEVRALVDRAQAEGEAALTAAGITFVSRDEDRRRRGDILQSKPIAGNGRSGGSSWQSLARGTGAIEADYLSGEIALVGRLHGVPAPVNELVQRLANEFARTARDPGSLPVEELVARLGPDT